MLFNSYTFWAFFAIVFVLYRFLPFRAQNIMLLLASYIFYGYWDWRFLFLMILSTVVDYFAAIGIQKYQSDKRGKVCLILSLAFQLSLLGVFKYYNFFANELSSLANSLQIPISLPILELLLPVGISFYTFQTMNYTIDVYKQKFDATKNFIDFALFVAFFPHLVAGPIVRAHKLLPQLSNPRHDREHDFREGLYYILFGLFKKVVIADNLAAVANTVFKTETNQLSGAECLVGIYAFAFQIYCDFSGYSSIAQGLAKWLNIDLTTNFNNPYFAESPSDFWRRWHISLSTWFRDYVYIPLAQRDKRADWITYTKNAMLVMLLSGLWHGAAWTFVAWGAYHGILLCIHRFFSAPRNSVSKDVESDESVNKSIVFRAIKIVIIFHLVCLGWLLFRAESMVQAFNMLGRIFTDFQVTNFAISSLVIILFYAGPLMIYELWLEYKGDLLQLTKVSRIPRAVLYSYWTMMLLYFPAPVSNVFIYFQF